MTTAPKPTALDLAAEVHAALTTLAGISDRLGLQPVAVNITATTYGSRRIAVQFTTDDRASVDKLGAEIGIPVADSAPTIYDRRGSVDGIEWGAFCGLTVDEDTPAAVTA